jgi:hypothetical protein
MKSWCWYLSSSSVVVSPGCWARRQLCELLPVLFQAVAHLLPSVSCLLLQALFSESLHGELTLFPSLVDGVLAGYFCRLCWKLVWRAAPCSPPSLVCSKHCTLSVPCLLFRFFFSVPCLLFSFFFFLHGRGQAVWGYADISQGWLLGTLCCLFAHLLFCISQAGLSQHLLKFLLNEWIYVFMSTCGQNCVISHE